MSAALDREIGAALAQVVRHAKLVVAKAAVLEDGPTRAATEDLHESLLTFEALAVQTAIDVVQVGPLSAAPPRDWLGVHCPACWRAMREHVIDALSHLRCPEVAR